MKKIIVLALAVTAFMTVPALLPADSEFVVSSCAAKAKKPKAELKEVTFHVHLHCEDCVKKVTENISFEKGVKDLKVSLEEQTVWVKFDASKTGVEKLAQAIAKLGYEVQEKENQ